MLLQIQRWAAWLCVSASLGLLWLLWLPGPSPALAQESAQEFVPDAAAAAESEFELELESAFEFESELEFSLELKS